MLRYLLFYGVKIPKLLIGDVPFSENPQSGALVGMFSHGNNRIGQDHCSRLRQIVLFISKALRPEACRQMTACGKSGYRVTLRLHLKLISVGQYVRDRIGQILQRVQQRAIQVKQYQPLHTLPPFRSAFSWKRAASTRKRL